MQPALLLPPIQLRPRSSRISSGIQVSCSFHSPLISSIDPDADRLGHIHTINDRCPQQSSLRTQRKMSSDIYTGTWINWTGGRVAGATLTISSQHGALLVAFLALFVSFAGSHLWDICRYAIFQYRCGRGPKDVYHQQQQLLLRNSTADTDMLWNLVKMTWAWRNTTKRPFLRSISLLIWATLQIIAFSAAGILSSQVATTQPEVLLRGSNCRTWSSRLNYLSPTFDPTSSEWTSDVADAHESFITSSRFTTSCYNQSSTSLEGCLPYGRRKLNWSNDTAACPFDKSMCIDNAAVQFDTGYLDTHLDLGINTPSEDRVQFRGISTCAPITTKGFASDWLNSTQADLPATSQPTPGELFLEFYYGETPARNVTPTFFFSNSTWIFEWDDSVTPNSYLLGQVISYSPLVLLVLIAKAILPHDLRTSLLLLSWDEHSIERAAIHVTNSVR